MRDDFDKVYADGRGGRDNWSAEKGKKKNIQKEEKAELVPTKKHFGGHRYIDRNYNAVKKFLNSKVGQNWDKVYSEFRQNLDPRKSFHHELIDRIKWHVTVDAIKVAKGVFAEPDGTIIYNDFYVDPSTGLLQRTKKSHNKDSFHRHNLPKYIRIDKRTFHKFKDCWFEVELVEIPGAPDESPFQMRRGYPNAPDQPKIPVYDKVLNKTITFSEAWDLHGSYVYAKTKRQLNSKEIKQFALKDKETRLFKHEEEEKEDPQA